MRDLTPNIPLLRKAVEWVEAEAAKPEPEREWEQKVYRVRSSVVRCNTAYCVAGKVATDADGPMSHLGNHEFANYAPSRARELLGLDHDQASTLFLFWNSADDIRRIAEDIAGERL